MVDKSSNAPSDAKAAVKKNLEKLEKIPAWQMDKVKSKKRCFSGSTKREKESPLCCIDGHLSSQECRVRTKAPKIQRTSRVPLGHDKR